MSRVYDPLNEAYIAVFGLKIALSMADEAPNRKDALEMICQARGLIVTLRDNLGENHPHYKTIAEASNELIDISHSNILNKRNLK